MQRKEEEDGEEWEEECQRIPLDERRRLKFFTLKSIREIASSRLPDYNCAGGGEE